MLLFRQYAPVVAVTSALLLVSLLLVLMIIAPGVRADAAADARKVIQATVDRENAAIANKDMNGAFAAYAPDFAARNAAGEQTSVPEMRREMQVVFQNVSAIKTVSTIQKFMLKGSLATVTVKTHADMTLNAPPKVKPSHGVIDEVKVDIWVKRGGVWQRKDSKQLSQTLTRDGKPLKVK